MSGGGRRGAATGRRAGNKSSGSVHAAAALHQHPERALFTSFCPSRWHVTVSCLHAQPVASTEARSTGSPTKPLSTCVEENDEERQGRGGCGQRLPELAAARRRPPPPELLPPCLPVLLPPPTHSPTCSRLWQPASTRLTACGRLLTSLTRAPSSCPAAPATPSSCMWSLVRVPVLSKQQVVTCGERRRGEGRWLERRAPRSMQWAARSCGPVQTAATTLQPQAPTAPHLAGHGDAKGLGAEDALAGQRQQGGVHSNRQLHGQLRRDDWNAGEGEGGGRCEWGTVGQLRWGLSTRSERGPAAAPTSHQRWQL